MAINWVAAGCVTMMPTGTKVASTIIPAGAGAIAGPQCGGLGSTGKKLSSDTW